MTVDAQRGIVYVPTGSATPDFYGGERIGANLFANTLLALDAATGSASGTSRPCITTSGIAISPPRPTSSPSRATGRRIDAVAQITKSGFVFLFDRATGAPLFPVEERPVPAPISRGEQTLADAAVPDASRRRSRGSA